MTYQAPAPVLRFLDFNNVGSVVAGICVDGNPTVDQADQTQSQDTPAPAQGLGPDSNLPSSIAYDSDNAFLTFRDNYNHCETTCLEFKAHRIAKLMTVLRPYQLSNSRGSRAWTFPRHDETTPSVPFMTQFVGGFWGTKTSARGTKLHKTHCEKTDFLWRPNSILANATAFRNYHNRQFFL
ncbi:hypothetical protein RRG08_063537 [Elysia crispata]|uniref:Uncharacterized protein n=1 Tax=Elysia crispata TaxID=231223 RepID=A0AAE1BGX6_9GAST|nr:hypothetical protein RRG08_063537 [Elysia crispata]